MENTVKSELKAGGVSGATAPPSLRLSVQDPSLVADGSTPAEALARSIELARLTDRLGYTRFWMNEHHGGSPFASVAPKILLARLGVETTHIRLGTGGIILPHYAPLKVAEIFRTLHSLYLNRGDLGIARPVGTPFPVEALRREHRVEPEDDFAEQLAELLAFLGVRPFAPEHPFSKIQVAPATPGDADVWLLGSSLRSAALAAQFGLPYAYSHFHNPLLTRQAFETYQQCFCPVRTGDLPRSIVLIGVICAETQAEANRLWASMYLFLQRARNRDLRLLPEPTETLRELADVDGQGLGSEQGEWPHFLVGTPDRVRHDLLSIADALRVDEFMVQSVCWDHAARLRSCQLLASVMELPAPNPAQLQGRQPAVLQ